MRLVAPPAMVLGALGLLLAAGPARAFFDWPPHPLPERRPARAALANGAAALDLAGLERRLRATEAIGFFTKLSLKNQVDDLLDRVREYHQGRPGARLPELRERYDLLLLKVLALLQDKDRPLAQDIGASREALWGLLADPVKFANLR